MWTWCYEDIIANRYNWVLTPEARACNQTLININSLLIFHLIVVPQLCANMGRGFWCGFGSIWIFSECYLSVHLPCFERINWLRLQFRFKNFIEYMTCGYEAGMQSNIKNTLVKRVSMSRDVTNAFEDWFLTLTYVCGGSLIDWV